MGSANRALERSEQRLRTEARKPTQRPHRDVQRVPVLVHGTRAMPHVWKLRRLRPRTLLLPARPSELATILEGHLNGDPTPAAHHEWGASKFT